MAGPHNPELTLAARFVHGTNRSVFLTGKAGTGKTTFLKELKETTRKRMAVLAPTGVAAINAGGVTLHSFFQLPFSPYIPGSKMALLNSLRFSKVKRTLLRQLELLVIDEVSMVRADVLDAVDAILGYFRDQPQAPFGGLQMLFIGDLFQLPPVYSEPEWEILGRHYDSPFFFEAHALKASPPICIELDRVYRQKDEVFLGILNRIRDNQASEQDLKALLRRYDPDFQAPQGEPYITLTSHNALAARINQAELRRLPSDARSFEAQVSGEFPEHAYPAERTLELKEGAQVMFLKNDKGEDRRYYNGKLATIDRITDDLIRVTFPGEENPLEVEPETWKNIRYGYDPDEHSVQEEELGSFRQYPLRLAWAITIHKSQGLTFDRAQIDAGNSFADGQVYVALSRLTRMEGLVLRSPIGPEAIHTNERVLAFSERMRTQPDPYAQLEADSLAFVRGLLLRHFDWTEVVDALQALYDGHEGKSFPGQAEAVLLAREWLDKARVQRATAVQFCKQLSALLSAAGQVEAMGTPAPPLRQRTEAASKYFSQVLQSELIDPLARHIEAFQRKVKVKKYVHTLRTLAADLNMKMRDLRQAVQLAEALVGGVGAEKLFDVISDRRLPSMGAGGQPDFAGAEKSAKPVKIASPRVSLDMFRSGQTPVEIAVARELTLSTIESHLISFIRVGEVNVQELVPSGKIADIEAAIAQVGDKALGPIRAITGDACSYNEIRAVMESVRAR